VKLLHLDRDNAARQNWAVRYLGGLKETVLTLPVTRAEASHVYHLFVVRSRERDALKEYLKEKGIGTLVHYPVPVHLQPAYKNRLKTSDMDATEKVAKEVLSLPMYPELAESDVDQVIEALRLFRKIR
jgi:dTDP-4-amino-4,6-dideoxygalactose transaminase